MFFSAPSRDTTALRSRWSFVPLVALLAMVFGVGITPLPASATTVGSVTVEGDVREVVFPGESPAKAESGFVVYVTDGSGDPVAGVEVTVSLDQFSDYVELSGAVTQTTEADGSAIFSSLIVTGGDFAPVQLKFEAGGKVVFTDEFFVLKDVGFSSIEVLMDDPEIFATELIYGLPIPLFLAAVQLCDEVLDCGEGFENLFLPIVLVDIAAALHTQLLFGAERSEPFLSPGFECVLKDENDFIDFEGCYGAIFSYADRVLDSLFAFTVDGAEYPSNMRQTWDFSNDPPGSPPVPSIVPFVNPVALYSDAPPLPVWFLGDDDDLLRFVLLGEALADRPVSVEFGVQRLSFAGFDGFVEKNSRAFTPVGDFGAPAVFSLADRNFFMPNPVAELARWGLEIEFSGDQRETLNDDFLHYEWSESTQSLIEGFVADLIDDVDDPDSSGLDPSNFSEVELFLLVLTELSLLQKQEILNFAAQNDFDVSGSGIEESLWLLSFLMGPFCQEECGDSLDTISDLWEKSDANSAELQELKDAVDVLRGDISKALDFFAEIDRFLNSVFSLGVDGQTETLSMFFTFFADDVSFVSDFALGSAAGDENLKVLAPEMFDDFEEFLADDVVIPEYIFFDPRCTDASQNCPLFIGGLSDLDFFRTDLRTAELAIDITLGGSPVSGIPQDPATGPLLQEFLEGLFFFISITGGDLIDSAHLFDFTTDIQRNFTLSPSTITTDSVDNSGGTVIQGEETSGGGPTPDTDPDSSTTPRPTSQVTSVTSSGVSVSPSPTQGILGQLFGGEPEDELTPDQEPLTAGTADPATVEAPDDDSEAVTTASGASQSGGSSLWPLAIGAGVLLTLLAAFAGAAMLRTRLR